MPENTKTVFNSDGSITVTSDSYTKTTVFNSDGSISDTVDTKDTDGKKQKIIQNTIFNSDGSIDNKVSVETEESGS